MSPQDAQEPRSGPETPTQVSGSRIPSEADIRSLGPQRIARLVLADLEDIEGGYAQTEPIQGLVASVRNLCFAVIEMETRYPEGWQR